MKYDNFYCSYKVSRQVGLQYFALYKKITAMGGEFTSSLSCFSTILKSLYFYAMLKMQYGFPLQPLTLMMEK
jgi:hypothetical protein